MSVYQKKYKLNFNWDYQFIAILQQTKISRLTMIYNFVNIKKI